MAWLHCSYCKRCSCPLRLTHPCLYTSSPSMHPATPGLPVTPLGSPLPQRGAEDPGPLPRRGVRNHLPQAPGVQALVGGAAAGRRARVRARPAAARQPTAAATEPNPGAQPHAPSPAVAAAADASTALAAGERGAVRAAAVHLPTVKAAGGRASFAADQVWGLGARGWGAGGGGRGGLGWGCR